MGDHNDNNVEIIEVLTYNTFDEFKEDLNLFKLDKDLQDDKYLCSELLISLLMNKTKDCNKKVYNDYHEDYNNIIILNGERIKLFYYYEDNVNLIDTSYYNPQIYDKLKYLYDNDDYNFIFENASSESIELLLKESDHFAFLLDKFDFNTIHSISPDYNSIKSEKIIDIIINKIDSKDKFDLLLENYLLRSLFCKMNNIYLLKKIINNEYFNEEYFCNRYDNNKNIFALINREIEFMNNLELVHYIDSFKLLFGDKETYSNIKKNITLNVLSIKDDSDHNCLYYLFRFCTVYNKLIENSITPKNNNLFNIIDLSEINYNIIEDNLIKKELTCMDLVECIFTIKKSCDELFNDDLTAVKLYDYFNSHKKLYFLSKIIICITPLKIIHKLIEINRIDMLFSDIRRDNIYIKMIGYLAEKIKYNECKEFWNILLDNNLVEKFINAKSTFNINWTDLNIDIELSKKIMDSEYFKRNMFFEINKNGTFNRTHAPIFSHLIKQNYFTNDELDKMDCYGISYLCYLMKYNIKELYENGYLLNKNTDEFINLTDSNINIIEFLLMKKITNINYLKKIMNIDLLVHLIVNTRYDLSPLFNDIKFMESIIKSNISIENFLILTKSIYFNKKILQIEDSNSPTPLYWTFLLEKPDYIIKLSPPTPELLTNSATVSFTSSHINSYIILKPIYDKLTSYKNIRNFMFSHKTTKSRGRKLIHYINNINVLIQLKKDFPDKLSTQLLEKSDNGNNIIYYLLRDTNDIEKMKLFIDEIGNLFGQNTLFYLFERKNNLNRNILFESIIIRPEITEYLYNNYYKDNRYLKDKDAYGNNIFHYLAKYNSDFLIKILDNYRKYIFDKSLINERNYMDESIIYYAKDNIDSFKRILKERNFDWNQLIIANIKIRNIINELDIKCLVEIFNYDAPLYLINDFFNDHNIYDIMKDKNNIIELAKTNNNNVHLNLLFKKPALYIIMNNPDLALNIRNIILDKKPELRNESFNIKILIEILKKQPYFIYKLLKSRYSFCIYKEYGIIISYLHLDYGCDLLDEFDKNILLKLKSITTNDSELQCNICYNFKTNIQLPCNQDHKFCVSCARSLEVKSCPYCREEFEMSDIKLL